MCGGEGFTRDGVALSVFYRVDPGYAAHLYSSTLFGNGPGGAYAKGRFTETKETWAAQTKPGWMQIDLGELLMIAGLEVRGGNNLLEWVTQFQVQFSPDAGDTWQYVDDRATFPCVGDRTLRATRMFAVPTLGRYIRIHVMAHQHAIAMGAAAVIHHGCYRMCSVADGGQCGANAECVGV